MKSVKWTSFMVRMYSELKDIPADVIREVFITVHWKFVPAKA